MNSSAGSPLVSPSGKWLGNPVAVVHAKLAGSPITALVQLSSPHYDATKHVLTFHVCHTLNLTFPHSTKPERACCMREGWTGVWLPKPETRAPHASLTCAGRTPD